MTHSELENHLLGKGVKPTANRILILRELAGSQRPLNLADLETSLSPMDKTSIFRVLELFAEKDIVHVIEDGTRSLKYEMCGSGHHTVEDQHVHFHCEKCGGLFCLEEISVPHIDLPEGYNMNSINFLVKGICPKCSAKT